MQTLFSNLVDALQSENFHALSSLLDGLSAASGGVNEGILNDTNS